MTGSVRTRLTLAVVVVVGAIAVVVALLAPRTVENALVADRLDAEGDVEQTALGRPVVFRSSTGDPLGSPELTALFGPDIAALSASLERHGVLDELRDFRADRSVLVAPIAGVLGEIDHDGRIRVRAGVAGADDGPVLSGPRMEQIAAELDPTSMFDEPLDVLGDGSIDDFLRELDDRLQGDLGNLDLGRLGDLERLGDLDGFDELGPVIRQLLDSEIIRDIPDPDPSSPLAPRTVDQLVFGTRTVDDVDLIVAASSDGIAITTDRIRTALWAAVPVAMLLTGLVTWMLAGRALRPVRAITEQTGRIRAGTLHERVPVPSSDDEVSGLAREMNDMLDRLQREDRRRRQFVADASHELRSPIASIHTQAEVALRSDDEAASELAAGVLEEAERLGTIVDDLLSLARHDETLLPPGAVVDLDDLVLAESARPRRVPVQVAQVSAGQVRGRIDELERVVRHLLDNAARHANAAVRVRLTTTDGRVLLDIDDDGPGIEAADRDRIFERFVRLDEARVRDAGGAGLGLAVVDAVVTAAGGRVTVDRSELGGARFTVDLPAAG